MNPALTHKRPLRTPCLQKRPETTGTPSLDMDFRHGGWWPDGDMLETGVASGSKWIIGGGGGLGVGGTIRFCSGDQHIICLAL